MLLTESDHPGVVFRVALCDHLLGLDVGGGGGVMTATTASSWRQCGHRATPLPLGRRGGGRYGVNDVEGSSTSWVTPFAASSPTPSWRGGVLARRLFGSVASNSGGWGFGW